MGKRSLTLELDDETLLRLSVLGEPAKVLEHLAFAAAEEVQYPGYNKRIRTDESLQSERDTSDAHMSRMRAVDQEHTDEALSDFRQQADRVVQLAHGPLISGGRTAQGEAALERAQSELDLGRTNAMDSLQHERAGTVEERGQSLTAERAGTDRRLRGERAHADTALVDQREANANMVSATIRAQELTEEAEEARRRAEASERELREVAEFREMFIGVLGHDLRTPLNSIVMASGLLIGHGALRQDDVRLAGRIVNAAQRMKRMITQLLDLTRARLGGGFPIERGQCDLRAVCRHVAEEFETAIELDIEGDVTGSWDQDRLIEVLSNLAGNGIEYGTPGTVVVVRAYPEAADVIVEVRNQGPAIPPDVLPFIFEPFRRAQPNKRSAAGNLGIGLYIAQQIVLSHGGTLHAHSADGTTSFVIRLPRTARA